MLCQECCCGLTYLRTRGLWGEGSFCALFCTRRVAHPWPKYERSYFKRKGQGPEMVNVLLGRCIKGSQLNFLARTRTHKGSEGVSRGGGFWAFRSQLTPLHAEDRLVFGLDRLLLLLSPPTVAHATKLRWHSCACWLQ